MGNLLYQDELLLICIHSSRLIPYLTILSRISIPLSKDGGKTMMWWYMYVLFKRSFKCYLGFDLGQVLGIARVVSSFNKQTRVFPGPATVLRVGD